MLVKKYGNRRLYDTAASRYITLEELAEAIKAGAGPTVVDAKTHKDLTQSTLAQIVIESRGATKLLPVPLLIQLIRLGDDALAEFFGRTVVWALDGYLQARQGALAFGNLAPFMAQAPLAPSPIARAPAPAPTRSPAPVSSKHDELAELRRDIELLRSSLTAEPAKKRKRA